MRTLSSIIAILALSQIGMAQEVKTEVPYQNSIDPEAITLIEDMIEWAETDIQEGIIKPVQGRILIDNLNDLKAKLQ